MIHPKTFKESGTILTISGEQYKQLVKKPQAVLWNRDGMYGLVPLARIKNQICNVRDYNQTVGYTNMEPKQYLMFAWEETEEIPVETGQVLERDG